MWTAGGTTTRNITAPAQSKVYVVVNASSSTQSIVLRGAGPTTGVTIVKGEKALCAWDGSDFVKVANQNGITTVQAGTAAAPAITTTGDTNTGIYFPAADTIAFSEGGVESARIDASGNVGIGVTPSAWGGSFKALQIVSGGTSLWSDGSVSFYNRNTFYDGTNRKYVVNGLAQEYAQLNDGSHAWKVAASGTAGNAISFTQAMTLDASGRLLINLTSALQGDPLEIQSASNSGCISLFGRASDNGSQLSFRANGANTLKASIYGSDVGLQFGIGSSGAEKARITSAGEFLVGATSKTGSGASEGKQVIRFAGATENGLYLDDTRTSAGADTAVVFGRGATGVGQIATTLTATSYATSSDYRLKENVAPMTGALEKVLELNPVTYTWKVDGSDGQGFIAHELQEVAPYAVSGEKDGEEMQGVDYGKITPLLTAALQKAIAKIETLEARIAVLEAK